MDRSRTSVGVISLFFNEMARRTGRFPQLVDSRSGVNGLLLRGSPRFREVSLEERAALDGSSSLRLLTATLPTRAHNS